MTCTTKFKKAVGVGLAVVALSMSAPEAATAAPQQPPTPRASGIPCFLNTPAFFTVDAFTVIDKETVTTTTAANGDVVQTTTGKLVLRFKNTSTGKSIVKNVSGSTTRTTHLDGSGVFVGTGKNWFGFGPNGQKNTGEPGLVFTSGRVALTFANGTVQTFSVDGHQENGCSLLSDDR